MKNRAAAAALLLVFIISTVASGQAEKQPAGLWDTAALKRTPAATWGKASGLVREVFYEGEPIGGKPTRVFGYYARPKEGRGPFPAMVLVHGGGGHAFAEWATLWAERGYVALAMDLSGRGPDRKRLPDGGPDQDDDSKFRKFSDDQPREMWTYYAIAAIIRSHSLMVAQAEVDSSRVGITGISWGGYLTCIAAGLDDRLKVAVPVYGCGFLHEDSYWAGRLSAMPAADRNRWVRSFDPSKYLAGVHCPILFINGTNDFAYPLDSYQNSYRLVPGAIDLCVTVGMPHGHSQGWAPKEIGIFVDSILKGGVPLARFGPLAMRDAVASATIVTKVPIASARLNFTLDTGVWMQRKWQHVDAAVKDGRISAALPKDRPVVFFLTATDQRGAIVSSEYADLR